MSEEALTKSEVDYIVREGIERFLSDLIHELKSRGFRSPDSHHITVKKSTLLDALEKVWSRYP